LGGDRARVLVHALVVGRLAGSAAIALRYLPTVLEVAIPTIGALVAGFVLILGARWSGSSQGWDILEGVLLRNGVLPLKAGLVTSASSLVTQASAGAGETGSRF
jgi:hypothetical protein